jgi:hypothetical protein
VGCWQCEDFPCPHGFFSQEADDSTPWITSSEYRGVCVGSVRCIRRYGLREFVGRVLTNLGTKVDYGHEFRFRAVGEMEALVRGDELSGDGV